jgi:DNA processing protein
VDELTCWLVLHRAPGLGSRGLSALLGRFPSPCAVLAAPPRDLESLGLEAETLAYLRTPALAGAEADLAWRESAGAHIVTVVDPRYPQRLRATADPPQVLYVLGDPEVLGVPQVAVVGSRSPTPGGAATAFEIARDLARAGLAVTSGMALGVDGAAHRGALAGGGLTVAVAGTGLDRVYPARHRDLAHAIAAEGALVSEYPPGTPPRPQQFPRRNRIIAGLALGTLVVEAAERSGSLITARLAGEEGREVFAVPGSVHNPLSRGCHRLIREGARLVEGARDVLEELAAVLPAGALAWAPAPASAEGPGPVPEDPEYRRLLDAMGYEPISVDTLVERSGLTADAVSSMLLLLELQGQVTSLAGGRYARIPHGS